MNINKKVNNKEVLLIDNFSLGNYFTLTSLVAQRLKCMFACNAEDLGSIPGSGRSAGGYGNALQYSCLEKPMDRGAWWATVHRIAESQTRLK